jgi:hypothetical protein
MKMPRTIYHGAVAPFVVSAPADLPAAGNALERRGLPRILFNNDSDDLKWPAYPEHHSAGLWVPEGKYLPLPTITSLGDSLFPRIGPLAKTEAAGLAYCGNFGVSICNLRREHIRALGEDPLQPILKFWKQDGRARLFPERTAGGDDPGMLALALLLEPDDMEEPNTGAAA